MKQQYFTIGVLSFFYATFAGFSQPANDNFANRIVLERNSLVFSGTLAGATRESDPYEVAPTFLFLGSVAQTAWWQWTPTQTTFVTFEILDSTQPAQGTDGVTVYELENIYTGQQVAGLPISDRLPNRFFTFSAIAGTNYYIQLAGESGASFNFRLNATDAPQIIAQPQDQSITVGDSTLFTVVATGPTPLAYQWQFNGTNLVGQTLPILAIDNANTNRSGNYRVWITNSAGITVSQSAHLSITATDPAPILAAAESFDPNKFAFSLIGEAGRRYRIQSSTDLTNWFSETSFAASTFFDPYQFQLPLRSVVSNLSQTNRLSLNRDAPAKFFRTTPFHAVNEVCNNNLKQIRFAQLLFAYETQVNELAPATENDLFRYMGGFPTCPSGGFYTLTLVTANPACSIHLFEEQ